MILGVLRSDVGSSLAGVDGYLHASVGRVRGDKTDSSVRELRLLGRGKHSDTIRSKLFRITRWRGGYLYSSEAFLQTGTASYRQGDETDTHHCHDCQCTLRLRKAMLCYWNGQLHDQARNIQKTQRCALSASSSQILASIPLITLPVPIHALSWSLEVSELRMTADVGEISFSLGQGHY